jgi:hypothetical protein
LMLATQHQRDIPVWVNCCPCDTSAGRPVYLG